MTTVVVSWAEAEFTVHNRAVVSWAEAEFTTAAAAQTTITGGDGKRRRYRRADDELTEAEAQFIQRKIAELKAAKTAREEAAAAKALEIALAQAAQDDEAAEIIAAAVEYEAPKRDYAAALRDVELMSQLGKELMALAKELAAERKRLADEDDIEVLLLL
jgi:hypothetical protein